MIRWVVTSILIIAEYLYLRAHGWRRFGRNRYLAPASYPFRRKDPYNRGHAVNAQRQRDFNPMFGGRRSG